MHLAIRPTRVLCAAAGILAAAGAGATAAALPPCATTVPAPAAVGPALPPIDAATNLLVIAPHPDDETLCCAGVIQRVLRVGGHASVAWLTSGDASLLDLLLIERTLIGSADEARRLGLRRMAEARAATARLGVPASGQLFLGYPDRGLLELLGEHRAAPYTSRVTTAATVPYPGTLFPGHPYTGESLERDLLAVIERVRPTLILAPSLLDSHPDHRAAGLLAAAAARRADGPQVYYWIVHGGEGWPTPRGLVTGIPLTPAPRSRALAPAPFALEPAEEDRKLLALQAYRSQMQVLAPFLLAFVRTTELFSARAEAAPAAARRAPGALPTP
ncbi:MAG TPA: PIG-L family deacetylase [Steroidobacteraceae bacterium]|nr:PIG-L family deacetylase [Steroidobacteraceae bacterium]